MKSVLFVAMAMVVGCAGQDLHEVGACGSGWGSGYAGCESACADYIGSIPMGSDAASVCVATDPRDGAMRDCLSGTFVADGVRGCCTPKHVGSGTGSGVPQFFECN